MLVQELIDSGLIEMYCLGVASDPERQLIEQFASTHEKVRNEIASVEKALGVYTGRTNKVPGRKVKRDLFDLIAVDEAKVLGLPSILSPDSEKSDWLKYIDENNAYPPANFEKLYMIGLPSSDNLITYVAYGHKGAIVEESHEGEIERLFMLKGSCKITFQGKTHAYKEGDFIEIGSNTLHLAEVDSDEMMILIGQRLVA